MTFLVWRIINYEWNRGAHTETEKNDPKTVGCGRLQIGYKIKHLIFNKDQGSGRS